MVLKKWVNLSPSEGSFHRLSLMKCIVSTSTDVDIQRLYLGRLENRRIDEKNKPSSTTKTTLM